MSIDGELQLTFIECLSFSLFLTCNHDRIMTSPHSFLVIEHSNVEWWSFNYQHQASADHLRDQHSRQRDCGRDLLPFLQGRTKGSRQWRECVQHRPNLISKTCKEAGQSRFWLRESSINRAVKATLSSSDRSVMGDWGWWFLWFAGSWRFQEDCLCGFWSLCHVRDCLWSQNSKS